MAREPSVQKDERGADTDDETAEFRGNDGLLHRRSYLKIAGVATAGALGTAAAGTAAAAEYDVIEVDPGERRVINVGDGETFENALIDVTANGADVTIAAHGTNWAVRNVGIRGRVPGNEAVFGVSDTGGGSSAIENVYIGDGAEDGHRMGLGIWVSPEHSGHIDISRVNIQEMGDNSFYCSAPGGAGGGTVHIDRCYSANSWVSHFRLSEGAVTNSTAVNDERRDDGRGVWAWGPGPIEVRNCNLDMNGRHYSIVAGANNRGTTVNVTDTQYDTGFNGGTRATDGSDINLGDGNGTSPEDVVPEGCPTSPEAAASGEGASGDAEPAAEPDESEADDEESDLENVLLFEGNDEAVSRYEFVVDGTVEASTDEGATVDDETAVEDGHARGVVANWRDAFRFDGSLEQLTVDGPATVSLNGEDVDPADYGAALPNVLEIEGEGTPASFEATVDGTLEVDTEEADSEPTVVSGTTVEGSVTDDVQRILFSGSLTDVTFTDGSAIVRVNGDVVDPDEYGDQELLPHALVVDGTGADGPSTYSFCVSGDVVKSTYRDASIDTEDAIDGRFVRGIVSNWRDAYWFSGELEDVTLVGDADVDVEYNVRSQ
ncbi:hypothetical protein [Natrononativus amylolyticus]|uniref:hypothetical protein n=1 Tax=Natrononativus amylolyticus TaxID=2963434 RepID=UPI0020CE1EFE|nr:hypothetical protein [Natrononativus amylolyticus]